MNLAKRTSLLLLPVVVFSYSLVAWFVYERESNVIKMFEQNRLEQRADHLKFVYTSYSSFVLAYVSSLLEGGVFSSYIGDSNSIYREKMLSSHLRAAISRFEGGGQLFASLSVFGSDNQPSLYIENSTDPFSQMGPEQPALVEEMAQKKLFKKWQFLPFAGAPEAALPVKARGHTLQGQSYIQYGITLDPRTLSMPVQLARQEITRIVVVVKPARFDDLVLKTQQEYRAKVSYLESKPATINKKASAFYAQAALSDGYVLAVERDDGYLDSQFKTLALRLLLMVILSIVFTFTLLQWLIRTFITGPVIQLDQQLTDVIEQRKENIGFSKSKDEVGRLGRKFHSLYQALNIAYQESYSQTRIDSLTLLPNRIRFNEVAQEKLSQAQESGSPLSVVYIDIDNFKFVNDKYGHEVGDNLLRSIARKFDDLIAKRLVGTDVPLAYRLSGDEFMMLLPGHDGFAAKSLGDDVLKLFSNGFKLGDKYFAVSASLGVACFPDDGTQLSQLVSNADLAMYQAKKTGKNRIENYSISLAENERALKEIEVALKEVKPDEQFSLCYMPVVDGEGRFKGCEALLRWLSPKLGHVSPADFIPVAEESGVFEMIDLWVLDQVFKDYARLKNICSEQFVVSINISSAELNSDRFIQQLQALCARYDIPAKNFMLEITETFAMEQGVDAINWLTKIRNLGFQMAIDDFGTGYTSLMQMVDYPVDVIKFDKQLVERVSTREQQHLAAALINLCHIQGILVVAEGVETQSQSLSLQRANCDYQQGFLIAKPMDLEMLPAWLEQRHPVVS